MSTTDTEDLAARVQRLEAAVWLLQAQLPAATYQQLATAPPALERPAHPPIAIAPATTAPSAEGRGDGIEAAIGTYWLSRLGIVALVTGIAWFIAIRFGDMSPALRVVVGYGVGAALTATGAWVARRHARLGHVVLGGGMAVGYFVTYALHFIPAVKMIEEPLAALLLLAMVVAAIVAVGQRLRSETVVGVALFLGFHTSLAFEIHAFTIASTTLLAAAAAYVFLRNRWVIVPLSTMVAVYASHAVAYDVHSAVLGAFDISPRSGALAVAFLVVYFVLFAGAALFQPPSPHPRWSAHASTISIAAGNILLFASFGLVATLDHRAWLLPMLLVTVVLFGGIAAAAQRRGARLLVAIHLAASAPVAAGVLVEVLPSPVAATAIALLGAGAVWWSVRRGHLVVAISAQLTIIVAMVGFAIPSKEAVVAPLVLGGALIACTRAWREATERGVASAMIAVAACAAAASLLIADHHALRDRALQTLGGVVVSLVLVAIGLAWRERALRFAGLGVLALATSKLLFIDLAQLPTDQRILTFVASGAILLALSYAYTRFRGRLERLL